MPVYDFDRYVRFEQAPVKSDYDTKPAGPVIICYAWAQIMPRRASEQIYAQQVTDVKASAAKIRFDPRVMAGMIMRHTVTDRAWDVTGVIDVGDRHEYLDLVIIDRSDSNAK